MKNRKFFLLLAVGILTVAITGGVIFAQNSRSQESVNSQIGTTPGGLASRIHSFSEGEYGRIDLSHGDAPSQSMMSRVAEILNIEESVLQGAFDQAHKGKQNDSMAYRLEHLVIDEKLTQEQSDEILAWFQSRPDAATKLRRQLLRGGDGLEHRLSHMVQRGVISQEEADAVLEWHGNMPQAFKDLSEQRFHRSPDSKSWGHFRPSERFQGRDMNRLGFQEHRFGGEGFAGQGFRWGGMQGGIWGNMMEGAHGLDPAGTQ